MVLDLHLTVQQIAKSTSISSGLVHTVLTEILGMSKLSARRVPRMLTPEQKLKRVDIFRILMTHFQIYPENFHHRLVTPDETWVYHIEPESKIQSKQWEHSNSPPTKKFKQAVPVGKVMASVFCDSEGIIMIDYLEKGKTINGQHYASEL